MRNIYYKNNTKTKYKYISCPNPAANAMQNYTQNYSYDALGNILNVTSQGSWTRDYVYNANNNYLLKHDPLQTFDDYTYDAHGNMLTMPHLSNMSYDYQDQLISAGNGTFSSYYNYDAEGNRTRKVVVKENIVEIRYYIGNYELYQKHVNGSLDFERKTINISDDEKVFLRIEQKIGENEVIRYQYDNHLGSACLELDELGAIISYEEYHPFGTTSYRSGRTETEVSLKRYKYCGKERDEETGLYYYGMRYYAAWLCRFVSVDPLQFKYPYYTPYQYAGNKPVSYIDLDGGEEKKVELAASIHFSAKFTFGVKGKSDFSIAGGIGGSAKYGVAMLGTNLSFNIYNSGLGTTSGSTGKRELQEEINLSTSLTLGFGKAHQPLPLSTFHSNALTGVVNSYKYSFTTGQTFAFSMRDGYHRVASTGAKLGDVSLMIYNDVKSWPALLFGGGTDEAYTGGGIMHIGLKKGFILSLGNDVFTGFRPGKINPQNNEIETNSEGRPIESGENPNWKYYVMPSQYDADLNSGQTFLQLSNIYNLGDSIRLQHSGSFDMFTQDLIHGKGTPHFKSTAVNSWQVK